MRLLHQRITLQITVFVETSDCMLWTSLAGRVVRCYANARKTLVWKPYWQALNSASHANSFKLSVLKQASICWSVNFTTSSWIFLGVKFTKSTICPIIDVSQETFSRRLTKRVVHFDCFPKYSSKRFFFDQTPNDILRCMNFCSWHYSMCQTSHPRSGFRRLQVFFFKFSPFVNIIVTHIFLPVRKALSPVFLSSGGHLLCQRLLLWCCIGYVTIWTQFPCHCNCGKNFSFVLLSSFLSVVPVSKMSLSKSRKIDTGGRVFPERWSVSYLFGFLCNEH